MKYKVINNLIGWLMFVVALAVYYMTLEPSVSLWDCGEFISASDKLQVVHPPGAPFFLLMGRLFAMFASSDAGVSVAVNLLSAICSALTVLFTFWITTHFARKIVGKDNDSTGNRIAIFASGIVAALALTFSDSFWFSAVEAEVYAMSSFFTAFTFWAALRWEESNSPYADKWLILIFYFIGLAIGTHLLNLLVIPAVAFIYYFKNFTYSRKGIIYCFLGGLGVLFFVQKGIIPGVPNLMAKMDHFFVNTMGFGFGSGSMFAIILLVALTGYGMYYFSKVKIHRMWNLAFICIAYVLLGYSSYAMVVVRSSDNPPIDMNNPEEPFNLLSYINREQYGDRPLAYGPYYNAPVAYDDNGYPQIDEGSTIYRKDSTEYTEIGKRQEYIYDKAYCTPFPRMGDMNKEGAESGYRFWSGMVEQDNKINILEQQVQQSKDPKEREQLSNELKEAKAEKPTMMNNMAFLFRYQLGHMYFRYFMWNFAGRQNDKQGHSFNQYTDGNWISGIPLVDNMRLGPQGDQPDYMENNQAKNKYFFLPLILGVFGLIFHFKKNKNDAIVTTVLFVFTGILIIIFLNQPPFEPRERDYSHVGSFQTFCIWIGLGVLFIWDKLKSKMNATSAAVLAGVLSLSAPVLMGEQGWDDHDRSGRYLGIDFAKNYLMSCPPNAILFTNGDNDTYPLWYAQNVEGIRTDIRIINQSLLPTDWYSQVLLTKVYDSEPLPLSITKHQLDAGINDYFQFDGSNPNPNPMDLRAFLNQLVNSKTPSFNTRTFTLPTNISKQGALAMGIKDTNNVVSQMTINFPGRGLNKGDLVLLDLVATNAERGWKRPICFTTTSGSDGFLNMEPYFERRGLIYQLIPVRTEASRNDVTRVNEDVLYDNLMNKYQYSGMNKKKHFFLDDKAEIVPSTLQQLFVSLAGTYVNKVEEMKFNDSTLSGADAQAKVAEYRKKSGALLDRCSEVLPEDVLLTKGNIKFSMAMIYHEIGQDDKAEKHLKGLFEIARQEAAYYVKFNGRSQATDYMKQVNTQDALDFMKRAADYAKRWGFTKTQADMEKTLKTLEPAVTSFING